MCCTRDLTLFILAFTICYAEAHDLSATSPLTESASAELVVQDPLCAALRKSAELRKTDSEAKFVASLVKEHPKSFVPDDCPKGQPKTLYRGAAYDQFDAGTVTRLLVGDSSAEIRSWDYSRLLEKNRAKLSDEWEAIRQTDQEIFQQIKSQVKTAKTPAAYADNQSVGTISGNDPAQKHATAIPFSATKGGAYYYTFAAWANIRTQIKKKLNLTDNDLQSRNIAKVFYVIDQLQPRAIPTCDEYYVLSHVPYKDMREVYFQPFSDGHSTTNWYDLEVSKRDPAGSTEEVTLYSVDMQDQYQPNPQKTVIGVFNKFRDAKKKLQTPDPKLKDVYAILTKWLSCF